MPTESTKVDAKSDSAELGPGSGTGSAIPRPDKEVVYQGVKIGTIRASDGCVEVTDIGAALNRLTEHFGVDDLEGLLGCLDDNDPLRELRDEFLFPQSLCGDAGDNNKVIYFLGNSLGLMPRRVKELVNRELTKWADLAIEGHFRGDLPWMPMDR
ncbi:hypothetical protein FOZ62_010015 [Perkinsus olseni]|uniref:Uncharacterized protein n=2 Tax=Perkinsus olseni TaxID=32597 RepID=A0A7J6SLU8_PEROL|nr:hypothetical protein FOZ62_010015 [Perkinsus olseni]